MSGALRSVLTSSLKPGTFCTGRIQDLYDAAGIDWKQKIRSSAGVDQQAVLISMAILIYSSQS